MAQIKKQDYALPRTAADLQEQYQFGRTFAEFLGLKDDTRKVSVKVSVVVDDNGDIKADDIVHAINAGLIKLTAERIEFNGSASFASAVSTEVEKTEISGNKIKTGAIQSTGYVANSKGLKIDLDLGTLDAKNFKVDKDGNVTVAGYIEIPYASDGMQGFFGKKDGKIGMLIEAMGETVIAAREKANGEPEVVLHPYFTRFRGNGFNEVSGEDIVNMLNEWRDFKDFHPELF